MVVRRSRAFVITVAAVAMAAGLTGCKIPGLSSDSAAEPSASQSAVELTPQQLVVNASKKSQQASSSKFRMAMKMTSGGKPMMNLVAVGAMDSKAEAMQMTMKLKLVGLGAAGTQTIRQKLVGGDYYMAGAGLGNGRQWVKLDAAKAKEFQQGSSNPADQLAAFEKLTSDVKEAGTATINGVQTTKYAGSLDLSTPAAPDESEQLKQARKDFADAGLTTVPFTYYIDDQGLLARLVMSMDINEEGQSGKMLMAMTFSDWGAPVQVTVPANAVEMGASTT